MKSEIQYFLNKSPYGNKELQYHKPHTPEKPDQYYTKQEIDYLLKNIDISQVKYLPTKKELTTILNGKVDTTDLNKYVPKTDDDGHGNKSFYGQGNLMMTLADEQGSINQTGTFSAGGWSVSSLDGRFQTFGNSIYRGTMGFDHDSVVWEKTATQQIPVATTEANGLMSAEDKEKLDALPTGGITAADVSYDNTRTGLPATNVQNAIDEMADTNLYETVVLTVGSADSSFNPVGQTITVTLEDGSATQYTVPMSRQITFIVQRGMRYTISGTSTDDYRVLPLSVKAAIPIRYLTMRYIPIATGVFILQKDGNYYLREEYDAETMAVDAVGVLVLTSALIKAKFGIVIGKNDVDQYGRWNSGTSWVNVGSSDQSALNGYSNTQLYLSHSNNASAVAANRCAASKIYMNDGTIVEGYWGSCAECSLINQNRTGINNCMEILNGGKILRTDYVSSTNAKPGGSWGNVRANKGFAEYKTNDYWRTYYRYLLS